MTNNFFGTREESVSWSTQWPECEIIFRGLPADAGCIVDNVETMIAIKHAVKDGVPVMKRIATITGDAITTPSNFLYSMGTPYEQLVEPLQRIDKYSRRNWYPGSSPPWDSPFWTWMFLPQRRLLLCHVLEKMRWQSLNRSHASAVAGVWKRVRKNWFQAGLQSSVSTDKRMSLNAGMD